MTRYFSPWVLWLARGCALAGVLALSIHYISAVHAASHAQAQVCEARLDALRARNLFVERFVRPADPCVALRVLGQP